MAFEPRLAFLGLGIPPLLIENWSSQKSESSLDESNWVLNFDDQWSGRWQLVVPMMG